VQQKVVAAATRSRSYQEASAELKESAELDISAKRCARIAQRAACEMLAERAQRCESFDKQPLARQKSGQPDEAPANSWDARVAAVIVDGGRAQVRDERWGTPQGQRTSKFFPCQDFGEEVGVPAGDLHFSAEAFFHRVVLQSRDGEASQPAQVVAQRPFARAAIILAKVDVQHPMHGLDAPMAADRFAKAFTA